MIHEQIRLELLAMRAEDLRVARSVQIGLSLMYRHPTIRGSGGNSSRGKNLRNSTLGKATFRVLHLDRRIHLRVRASVVRIESVPVAQLCQSLRCSTARVYACRADPVELSK